MDGVFFYWLTRSIEFLFVGTLKAIGFFIEKIDVVDALLTGLLLWVTLVSTWKVDKVISFIASAAIALTIYLAIRSRIGFWVLSALYSLLYGVFLAILTTEWLLSLLPVHGEIAREFILIGYAFVCATPFYWLHFSAHQRREERMLKEMAGVYEDGSPV